MKKRRGFTLFEVLMVLLLVSLLLSMLLLIVSRLSRMTVETTQASLRRRQWMQAGEQLRWQLRNLLLPGVSESSAQQGIRPGLLGGPEIPLWGAPQQQEGQDFAVFITTVPKQQRGACEVGYRLQARADGAGYDLVYREFPLRDRGGLHPPSDSPDAPWKVILEHASQLSLDYSEDGWQWRRDWNLGQIPKRIRVHLEARDLPVLDFQVTPGAGGGRW